MLQFLPLLVVAAIFIAVFVILIKKTPNNAAYKYAVAVALVAAFMLFWVNGAVGIIGNSNNDANMLYGGVIAIGAIGALVARFKPHGMARALLAMAIAHALIGVVALIAGWGTDGNIWPWDVLGATVIFTALWLVSAWLFQKATGNTNPVP